MNSEHDPKAFAAVMAALLVFWALVFGLYFCAKIGSSAPNPPAYEAKP